jgi:hypothetical protein
VNISSIVTALVLVLPVSQSIAGCYARTDARARNRFVLRENEAFETKTRLIWQRRSLGMTWEGRHGCAGEMMSVDLDEANTKAQEFGKN